MRCDCGNDSAPRMSFRKGSWLCTLCSDVVFNTWVPDVYWDEEPVDNLTGDDGKPMTFLSKRHKAMWMRERNIGEAGDRIHGAPLSSISNVKKPDHEKSRIQVREAFSKAKSDLKRKYGT